MAHDAVKPSLAVFFLIADQAIKNSISSTTSFLGVVFPRVTNTGASFGIFQGYNTALIISSILILSGIVWYRDELPAWSVWLFLAGGVSNTVDRIVHGHVIDYISIGWWPVFNIADAMLCVGVAIVIYDEVTS